MDEQPRGLLIVLDSKRQQVEEMLPEGHKVVAEKRNLCEGNSTWIIEGPLMAARTDLPLVRLDQSVMISAGGEVTLNLWFTHVPDKPWHKSFPSVDGYLAWLARVDVAADLTVP